MSIPFNCLELGAIKDRSPYFEDNISSCCKHNLFCIRRFRKGGESQTKWIILALGSCLLMILTELQFMRTHFHNSVSLYENYI